LESGAGTAKAVPSVGGISGGKVSDMQRESLIAFSKYERIF
jgi:hypothetical protein